MRAGGWVPLGRWEKDEEEEEDDAARTPKNDASKGGEMGDCRMKTHLRDTASLGPPRVKSSNKPAERYPCEISNATHNELGNPEMWVPRLHLKITAAPLTTL